MALRGALTLIVLAAVLLGWARASAAAERLALDEDWQLQSTAALPFTGEAMSTAGFADGQWYTTAVPRTVLAALVDNGLYPDPFYGDNLTKIPGYRSGLWLAMAPESPFYPSWWYRREFDVPTTFAGKHVVLHLDGVNYRANVWLNGHKVADDQHVVGMFRRFEFDVDPFIEIGQRNALAIEVTAPGHVEDKDYRTKQIEATTGWDDHNPQPPDLNMGLWQKVCLTATGPVAVRHPYVASKLSVPRLDEARLTVSARLVNKTDCPVTATLAATIEERRVEQEVTLAALEQRDVAFTHDDFAALVIAQPRVWWPSQLGSPELYDAHIECLVNGQVSDATDIRFGIRDATTYINDEGWRQYMINGRKVLIRGGAWMTCDMLLRLSPRRYEALIRYAKEAGLNMLRSEGFSIRETDEFYDLCDRYGVMVTQQLFGRSIPDEDLAIACIDDTLLRIRNHPSLVHFLGHDETFPTKRLDAAYRQKIADYCPDRTYQPHSGTFVVVTRRRTGGTRTGSMATWQHVGPAHYYISKATGAWGFAQSGGIGGVFASLESTRRMMPEEDLWPPFTDTWSLHTVTQGGGYFRDVLAHIDTRYGPPKDVEDFFRKGLAINYNGARAMFEAYGRNKYSATGLTTWKYDAAWPASPTWQYIDWYLVATAAYYGAKKACEPIHIQYSYDDDSIWAVNGRVEPATDLVARAVLCNFDMTEMWSRTTTLDLDPDGKQCLFTIGKPAGLSTTFFLLLTLDTTAGTRVSENLYWLSTQPETKKILGLQFTQFAPGADFTALEQLPPVALESEVAFAAVDGETEARVALRNPSDHLAFAVHLLLTQGEGGLEIAPTYWSDNYFAILPHSEKIVAARFAEADAGGATPTLVVKGWNMGH
ncbi:MAG TPA: hypothetical protein PLO37_23320 [Candidatus Hydrogenedentes bacterium]|nr:hypothetical protein [Candidatus Hydrogenedentota bacterium]HPG69791.1 hypothetical protein [Candidatus Hydrogenedentota bacterium]